jgi:hypothetical protein
MHMALTTLPCASALASDIAGDRCVGSILKQRNACGRALYRTLFRLLAAPLNDGAQQWWGGA